MITYHTEKWYKMAEKRAWEFISHPKGNRTTNVLIESLGGFIEKENMRNQQTAAKLFLQGTLKRIKNCGMAPGSCWVKQRNVQ